MGTLETEQDHHSDYFRSKKKGEKLLTKFGDTIESELIIEK
jgi:hypothetical protein